MEFTSAFGYGSLEVQHDPSATNEAPCCCDGCTKSRFYQSYYAQAPVSTLPALEEMTDTDSQNAASGLIDQSGLSCLLPSPENEEVGVVKLIAIASFRFGSFFSATD